jgi:hypothetical protein
MGHVLTARGSQLLTADSSSGQSVCSRLLDLVDAQMPVFIVEKSRMSALILPMRIPASAGGHRWPDEIGRRLAA